MTTDTSLENKSLVAHLLRRAGFGGTVTELDHFSSMDYEQAVDQLLDAVDTSSLPQDLIRRYHIDQSDLRTGLSSGSNWVYRMATTDAPLIEKVALFWHRVFATAQTKLIQGKVMTSQIEMFRNYGLGNFREILIQLSKNPAMILFLDNQDNHKDSINENYGRELLELFSMGVGNYTEEDIKECSRAFTGWTVANTDYMALKMRNNTMRPYGYIAWQYKYDENDHYDGEKNSPEIQKLKGMIREFEEELVWANYGVRVKDVHHLRLGFYKGDIFTEQPQKKRDVTPILDQLRELQPTVITLAMDPEGSGPDTHYKVLQSIAEAVRMWNKEADLSSLRIWGYRNVWYRFNLAEADIIVPVTLNSMSILNSTFMNCYLSQKDASFPSYEYDGPFCELSQKIWVEQHRDLQLMLGRDYWYRNKNPHLRAVHGAIYLKEMNADSFLNFATKIEDTVEGSVTLSI